MNQDISKKEASKFGFVTVLGATNSGKSTLINFIIGEKVSIVSHKVQTTKNIIMGVYTKDNNQIAFIDTPGIFDARNTKDKSVVSLSYRSAMQANMVMVLIDATKPIKDSVLKILEDLNKQKTHVILVINKIDLITNKQTLLSIVAKLSTLADFKKTFMISALKGDGVGDIVYYINNTLLAGDWLFINDEISNKSIKFVATEATREQIYKLVHKEIPYMTSVVNDFWEEKHFSVKIEQIIYVKTLSHKKIIIGKNGSLIKQIGSSARWELSKLLGKKVHLHLFVKLKPDSVNQIDIPE